MFDGLLVEAYGRADGGGFAGGGFELFVGLGVGELDGADAAEVVEVAADLVVGCGGWELSLSDEEVGLRDVGCADVISQQ